MSIKKKMKKDPHGAQGEQRPLQASLTPLLFFLFFLFFY